MGDLSDLCLLVHDVKHVGIDLNLVQTEGVHFPQSIKRFFRFLEIWFRESKD